MASHNDQQPAATAAQIQTQTDTLPSSTPVELSHLDASHQQDEPVSPMSPTAEQFATPPQSARHSTLGAAMPGVSPMSGDDQASPGAEQTLPEIGMTTATHQHDGTTTADIDEKTPTTPTKEASTEDRTSPVFPIQPTTPGIGPAFSQNHIPPTIENSDPAEPVLQLIIMLISGARHPFTLSRSYLEKRGVQNTKLKTKAAMVEASGLDPYGISGYTLKELIWRDWRSEWEGRPSNPGSIRLISLGRLVDDNKPLADYFSREREATSANHVVHMTVKPAEFDDDDGTHKTKRRKDAEEAAGAGGSCCRCCSVM